MYKIALSGKANTGKNTVSKILYQKLSKNQTNIACEYIAFADPIKAMIRNMFPNLPEKYLTGSSQFRAECIPGAFKNNNPLTVRQLLIDLGTASKNYQMNIWIGALDNAFKKALHKNKNMVIVTDVRFRNEFEYLKKMGFYQIRLLRDCNTKINDSSEIDQDSITDDEFDCILHNNGTLKDLKMAVAQAATMISP
jgi:hypothetical protein